MRVKRDREMKRQESKIGDEGLTAQKDHRPDKTHVQGVQIETQQRGLRFNRCSHTAQMVHRHNKKKNRKLLCC